MNLNDIKNNPQVLNFIQQTEEALGALAYTDHGLRHTDIVSNRAMKIAKDIIATQTKEIAEMKTWCK